MPLQTQRKVGALGKSRSRYVILPRRWCDRTRVGPGSEVELLGGRVLVLIPPKARADAEAIRRLMLRRRLL